MVLLLADNVEKPLEAGVVGLSMLNSTNLSRKWRVSTVNLISLEHDPGLDLEHVDSVVESKKEQSLECIYLCCLSIPGILQSPKQSGRYCTQSSRLW